MMEKIHITNTKGQTMCSKEFWKNNQNEIVISENFYQLDKKLFCKKCAEALGKPYFSNDDLFEMGIVG